MIYPRHLIGGDIDHVVYILAIWLADINHVILFLWLQHELQKDYDTVSEMLEEKQLEVEQLTSHLLESKHLEVSHRQLTNSVGGCVTQ